MTRPTFVVVTPPEDGAQIIGGTKRFLHGGPRYRDLADTILSPHGEVRHLGWAPDWAGDRGSFASSLADADALVVAPWLGGTELPAFDGELFGLAPELGVIAGTFDFRLAWIDLDEAIRRDVVVIDTSRTMTPTVAEFGVAITLALLRDIPGAIDVVRAGEWFDSSTADHSYVFRDLADCRIGLAGYGSINRHYRRFVEPYGCVVGIYDPFVDDGVEATDSVVRTGSLVDLARTSDVLVVAIPPTPTTLGVVDASVIDALAPGSLFVLLSRMAVVEQDALWRRVRAGELRAAVDVYQPEPPAADAWFRRDPNVLPTPHIAGNVRFAHERCFAEACADAARVVRGEEPRHRATIVDKRLYEGSA